MQASPGEAAAGGDDYLGLSVSELRDALATAVAAEEYLKAARIRDAIQ